MRPPVLLLVFFFLLLGALPRAVLCPRHASPPLATETLDVAASLSRARAAVSTEAVSLHQSAAAVEVVGEHEEGLGLRVHSRDFLPEEQGRHQSYRSLVLARLRRDSARAAAPQAYAALRDAFARGTQSLARTSGVSLFDTCYDLSDRTSVEVPAGARRFEGGGELRLPAKNYLIPVDGAGTYCLAFAATNAAVSIIGNVQQQGTRVSFDTAKATVGFTSNKC
uniref:Xylanase inhibitor C-terminal domain-containing protein n=1 Tax=Oryza brachyantha TaxID=4533 RepID=J3KWA0_ORYBR